MTDAAPDGAFLKLLHKTIKKVSRDTDTLNFNTAAKSYATFIGIGVDFNSELVESISKIRGANYYSVHSAEEFKKRLDDEFEFMVTPLVFGLTLKLGGAYYSGVALACLLLGYEHWLLRNGDLAKLDFAFFTMNGYVSVIIFGATILEIIVTGGGK